MTLLDILLLITLGQSAIAASSLTSQTWIDFVAKDNEVYPYGQCLLYHSCNKTQDLIDTFEEMLAIFNITDGDPLGNPQSKELKLCECDAGSCGKYGTCCRDVVDFQIPERTVSTKCITQSTRIIRPFRVNVECPSDFSDSTIRRLCETPINSTTSKPDLEYWFVSSNKTMYTYRNMYCALCNGESMDNLVFWDIDWICYTLNNNLTSTNSNLSEIYSSCTAYFTNTKFFDKCKLFGLLVDECPPTYNNSVIQKQCEYGSFGPMKQLSSGEWYKNIYCATCNEKTDSLYCPDPYEEYIRYTIRILVHPFGQTCSDTDSGEKVSGKSCDELSSTFSSCADGEIYSWTNQNCRSICSPPLHLVNGECLIMHLPDSADSTGPDASFILIANSTSTKCQHLSYKNFVEIRHQQQNDTRLSYFSVDTLEMTVFHNMSVSSKYCTTCNWTQYNVEDLTFDDSTFPSVTLPDGTVHSDGLYLLRNDSTVFLCHNITNSSVAKELLGKICIKVEEAAVSITMMSISIACLIIMIIMYSILPNLHNVPGFIVLSQVVPLLLGYIFFLLRGVAVGSPTGCYIISVLIHYTFLSSNIWAFLFAVEITITLTSVYAVNQKSKKKFIRYSIAGWTVPLIPVITAIVIDHVDPLSEFAPDYGLPQCWFNSAYGLYVYFLIPIAITLLLNFISYIIIIIRFAVLVYQTQGVKTSHKEKLILSVKLFFAFGLLWIFGVLSAIFRDNQAISCIFVFVNTLSGVLLMLVFICNGAVYKGLRKHIATTSSQTDTSTQMTNKHKSRLVPSNTSSNNSSFNTQKTLQSSKI